LLSGLVAVFCAYVVWSSLHSGHAPSFSFRQAGPSPFTRADDPQQFWFGITLYALFGVFAAWLAWRSWRGQRT
jgi:hypothetical protein